MFLARGNHHTVAALEHPGAIVELDLEGSLENLTK